MDPNIDLGKIHMEPKKGRFGSHAFSGFQLGELLGSSRSSSGVFSASSAVVGVEHPNVSTKSGQVEETHPSNKYAQG